jgi:hypothetical protein
MNKESFETMFALCERAAQIAEKNKNFINMWKYAGKMELLCGMGRAVGIEASLVAEKEAVAKGFDERARTVHLDFLEDTAASFFKIHGLQ